MSNFPNGLRASRRCLVFLSSFWCAEFAESRIRSYKPWRLTSSIYHWMGPNKMTTNCTQLCCFPFIFVCRRRRRRRAMPMLKLIGSNTHVIDGVDKARAIIWMNETNEKNKRHQIDETFYRTFHLPQRISATTRTIRAIVFMHALFCHLSTAQW